MLLILAGFLGGLCLGWLAGGRAKIRRQPATRLDFFKSSPADDQRRLRAAEAALADLEVQYCQQFMADVAEAERRCDCHRQGQ